MNESISLHALVTETPVTLPAYPHVDPKVRPKIVVQPLTALGSSFYSVACPMHKLLVLIVLTYFTFV